jgi:hypothetical protein
VTSLVDRIQRLDASCLTPFPRRRTRSTAGPAEPARCPGIGIRHVWLCRNRVISRRLVAGSAPRYRCAQVLSIDPRLAEPPDKPPGGFYDANTTNHMRDLLGSLPDADLSKLTTIEADTDELRAEAVPFRPAFCFIDGEHTDEAALRDALLPGRDGRWPRDHRVPRPPDRAARHPACSSTNAGARCLPSSCLQDRCTLAVEFGDRRLVRCSLVECAIASPSHACVWSVASASRRSPRLLFFALAATPRLDHLIASAKGISRHRRPPQRLDQ